MRRNWSHLLTFFILVATQAAVGDLGRFLQQMELNRREDRIDSERALQAHMQYMQQQQLNMQQQLQLQLQQIDEGRGRRRSPSEKFHGSEGRRRRPDGSGDRRR